MNILFLHPNFPAQFRHITSYLGRDSRNRVVFGTMNEDTGEIPGVRKEFYKPHRGPDPKTHHYLKFLESGVLQGQAVFNMLQNLRKEKFIPDIVYGHSGWGPTMFIKDIFPQAQCLCYFEWFYNSSGSDVDFDPADRPKADALLKLRMKNTPILTDLYSCDRGLSPTYWQMQQFPPEFRNKITVIHDGIDTAYFRPGQGEPLKIPSAGLDLAGVKEVVTYVGRGFEPYRGFPQFMEAAGLILEKRPKCHIVMVGTDNVYYGRSPSNGRSYRQIALEKNDFDMSRLHFTGLLSYPDYLKVLQASSVHVYLSYPFVLSWSMLEAMSTGCLVVGSNTAPVTEFIVDGENGLLADFFSPREIAGRVIEALKKPKKMESIRERARKTIVNNYDLAMLLPRHLKWIAGH